ncbi:hypothetical protein N2152v2_001859 [Parachlorella kessleri]
MAQAKTAAGQPVVEFGAAAREELFLLDPGVTYLNHGSYGATLRLLFEAQAFYHRRQEAQPVLFMETEALQGMIAAQRAVALEVGADPRDLVVLPNATTAVNTVLHSLRLQRGEHLLVTDLTYPAVRNAAARLAAEAGAGLVEVRILDVLEDRHRLVQRFEAGLAAGKGRIRLCIIDHIISALPVHLPVYELCALCKRYAVPALVDGAHAVGAVTLDLASLGATYYTSNLHKWLCSPKGTAFLWVAPEAQAGLAPLVTSHGYNLGFQGDFFWRGTNDYTAFLTLPAAVAIMRLLDTGGAARRYRHNLLAQAVSVLLDAWGTEEVLGLDAPESCMAAVELPHLGAFTAAPNQHDSPDPSSNGTTVFSRSRHETNGATSHARAKPSAVWCEPTSATAEALHAALRWRFQIEVPVICLRGKLYVRLSAQIYNQLDDYRRLGSAVLELQGGVL